MALVRVPFYFINLLPTSLLYISILLAATESTAPVTPTAVVESFQDFCTNKNTKNLAEKDTLMKVSHDIRPKFAMAQNMFLKFKTLHNKNEEITHGI